MKEIINKGKMENEIRKYFLVSTKFLSKRKIEKPYYQIK